MQRSVGCRRLVAPAIVLGAGIISSAPGWSQSALDEWITQGKTSLVLNHRFEFVDDQANDLDSASASTLRAFLGYATAERAGFSVHVGLEGVLHVGLNDFNVPGEASEGFDVVADPQGIEFDEAYLSYKGLPDTSLKVGRQYVSFRTAPSHRFVGTVPWRQNWQSMDAVRLVNRSVADLTLDYVYVHNVNRIFGENNDNEALANSPMNSHLLNVKYGGLRVGEIEGFYYRLDYDNDTLPAPFTDRATLGLKFQGDAQLSERLKFLYLAEISQQSAIGDNPSAFDSADQYRVEAGLNFGFGLTAKVAYEVLESSNGASFSTPLATVHAFQGWADRLIGFPGGGVEDLYVVGMSTLPGSIKMMTTFHNYQSAADGIEYGSEFNIQFTKKIRRFTLQLKHASYFGDEEPSAGALAFDKTITWFTTRWAL
ncbi:MAG: alginate export family protein [Pseudomonadota bacterium]